MLYNYIVIWMLGWMVNLHPFYISVTDINYNAEAKSLEIAQKIFWDDLEQALSKKYDEDLDFLHPQDPERLSDFVKAYLLENNVYEINGKVVKLEYLGYEVEEDAAWFYLEAKNVSFPKKVKISNKVLISDFPEQQNMVNFYLNDKPKTLILYKDHEVDDLDFD
ncbi:hypothetical protein KZP23_04505 [Echinicola marina]|uniref:DUF6702 family protein n=1 Tax=Echinicola marina TaxID=2859768 RepID=UPI001CF620C5|nr:DUF6702 family protein [Echinicola marina]UCS94297.1 hypothetical protein KZP23_04505 [Echinicola marina]